MSQITGLFDLEVESDGRTTITTAAPIIAPTSVAPHFSQGIVGIGIARCRKEDRFSPEIGLYLSASRAMRNLLDQVEERALSAVETEEQARMRELGEDIAEGINDLIEGFNDAFARAGLGHFTVGSR